MCGISGRFNFDGEPVEAEAVVVMRDALTHRGPDDAGVYVRGPVGLGHRRLSIIDLSGGHQPLTNEDGTVVIVFNGEIYNFLDLRRDLLARGHTFKTKSDTEVIVHLYEDHGSDCVKWLRGMFAFALWDGRRNSLLLARDRVGEKPLYYAATSRSLHFASEIKGLLAARDVGAQADPVGLRRYLTYRHAYGHGTLFKGIYQVPPGCCVVADATGTKLQRYWDVPVRDERAVAPADTGFLPLLEQSVAERMISDVPIGAFLSGGLDSSIVTTLMARHASSVSTFSIGFVPGEENELSWAKSVAAACGADHHELTQGAGDFFGLLRKLIWHHDEPLTFPASIPLYLLSRESKRIATVMLAGEGADELLAGYGNNISTYRLARLARRIPATLRRRLGRNSATGRLAAIARRLGQSEDELIVGAFRLPDHARLVGACRLELPAAAADDARLFADVGLDSRQGSFLDRLLYFQFKTYLIALLMKQDKMSMAASIETRVPFLDHRLVELAFGLPDSAKIRGKVGKYVLREASKGLLSPGVIRRPKMGFPVPIARWFREPGNPFMDVLLDPESLRDGLLDAGYVRQRVDCFNKGEPISAEIWAILNLELWRRTFLAPAKIVARSVVPSI